MAVEKLGGSLQENLLVLACWSDKSFQLVRNTVSPNLFTTDIFRDTVERVYEFIDAHKKPPKDYLPDLVEKQLKGNNGPLYKDLIKGIREVKDNVLTNEEWPLSQLEKFIRQQNLKIGIIEAHDFIQQGKLEEAEVAIEKRLKERLSLFSGGMTLEQAFKDLYINGDFREALNLGIPELDKHYLGPARKELYALIGPKKGGKTWWLIHLAKRGVLFNHRVSIVTLEVSERLYSARTIQSIYSMSMREARTHVTTFERDQNQKVTGLLKERISRPHMLDTEGVVKGLRKEVKGLHRYSKMLRIKEFPTGALTVNGYRAYLDSLERIENFVPDILIVDYPKLMNLSNDDIRVGLMQTLEQLRGIAVERNSMLCVVGQANRSGVKAQTTRGTDSAEDFSINMTADVVLTYSQTEAEYQLNLARLGVDGSRISRQHINLMVSQNYELGQFHFDSAPMMENYHAEVEKVSGKAMVEE